MLIYHGSKDIIEKPEYGKGKPYNDYGLGFYCTKDIEMAKEWGCGESYDGYANIYDIDTEGLTILDLNANEFTILHWLTLLLKNRTFRLTNRIAKDAKEYLLHNFAVDTASCDIITGYRADDSYFSFAEDFLNNAISVKRLAQAMKLGNLGEQFVLLSKESFRHIHFVEAKSAPRSKYFVLKNKRDKAARSEYLNSNRKAEYNTDELYMIDIIRQEVKSNDTRLR